MPRSDLIHGPGRRTFSRATAAAKKRFLGAVAATGSIVAGAVAAGRSKGTVYHWRDSDPLFAEQWDDALTVALAALETEAYRRAVQGTEQPVMSGGKVVATVRRYSDRLLALLLRAHAPERYAEPKLAGPKLNAAIGLRRGEKPPVRFTFRINDAPEDGPALGGAGAPFTFRIRSPGEEIGGD
jgi:hypothetical protein